MSQFEKVDCSRGAPMGRSEYRPALSVKLPKKSVRLFKVNLDSAGYDDGGAYWGTPSNLYCAIGDGENLGEGEYREFVRADCRRGAARRLELLHGNVLKREPK